LSSDSDNHQVKVLYIGGAGRSGSTLLEMMLSQSQGVLALGEMCWIWERSLEGNELCGCGEPFHDCPFWTQVFEEAFGGFEQIDLNRIQYLRRNLERIRFIPVHLVSALQAAQFQQLSNEYTGILEALYTTLQKVSGCRFIVDSSKSPPFGFNLSHAGKLDLRVVHLIRDSRAVAYSWQRKKIRPEIHWSTQLMPQFNLVRSARMWNVGNTGGHLLKYAVNRYLLLHYEDLTQNPVSVLKQVMNFMEFPEADLSFLQGDHFHANPTHTVAGNPLRFTNGNITVKTDEEWKSAMPPLQKYITTGLTWPLLLKYRYLF